MFKPTSNKVQFPELEEAVLTLWDEIGAFAASINQRPASNTFYFYDGPPFATGLPHYGHLLASTIKDVVPRYQTMLGKRVERRFGWDCHGLPVEFEVEKDLGLKGKADIVEYGVDRFNEKCRSIVLRYAGEWRQTIRRMGRWVDMDNDYKTMDPEFMETIWWVFKELYQKGLIYESKKIVPYSPRLGTPLSNFEVNLGYQDVQDPAVTLRFKLTGEEANFLAWTTTPWTLPSNLGLTVHPDHDYVMVETAGERLVLAQALLSANLPKEAEYKVLWTKKGRELEGMEYEPLFPYFAGLAAEGCFRVFLGQYVTLDTGTGIVHTAPSFGEDDFLTGQKYKLPLVFPMDDNGHFNEEAKEYAGLFFKDADKEILKDLKHRGRIFKHETLTHAYPFCWRSGVPLMYRTIGSWFLDVEKIKDQMLTHNQEIHWKPEHIKDGRMGKWLEGARAWAISRNRYWGNPIPVWVCPACGQRHCVGSKAELEELCGSKVEDLHSHFIDPLTIPCPACKEPMRRTPEVLDCWFESGSMPYGQQHYPFENKAAFESLFPADFISEGIDQTRGWFYTLLVLSSALFDKPAFKNCIVSGMLLAEDGKKMSKSLKNYPDPKVMLDTYGADVVRLYMLNSGAIKAEELRFSETGLKETLRNTFIPLWNVLSFFTTYAAVDQYEGRFLEDASGLKNPLDRWIYSSLHHLITEVRAGMDDFDLNRSVAPFVGFIDLLTNWYVRRSRRRFWKSEDDQDKAQAYDTLYTVLHELSRVIAPFVPFLAENLYQVLRQENEPLSVHLCDFPVPKAQVVNRELEEEMAIILKAVNLGRALRAKHQLKIRQPLAKLTIVTQNQSLRGVLGQMQHLITEELNVKEVEIAGNEEALVHLSAKPNLKLLGPKLGKKLGLFREEVAKLSTTQIVAIQGGQRLTLDLGGEPFELGIEELFLERSERPGIFSVNEGDLTVALDSQLTPELIAEGLAREFVNKVQQTRKELDLNVTDRINITYSGTQELQQALALHADYLTQETLANQVTPLPSPAPGMTEWDLNGSPCFLGVERV
ncbi:MAG: isoleucine--tRNA ligase [Candidatus Lambdaproteobacteria bacterium RIFOXYD1_FULL_56_27]|uniref:Isoleucine--tRNA ligase n=1 Tax=Candidatus Lambdaproteobacteria bacterium RIFOXYD2_FULL_56_26 TaxID=1817773 RepID=A0A1F6GR93_9PROT|nr:MAG: isoleucine--tRNA ligase [Candidatus Lambdaproteobacteria bacterium RIFOXYD2_FULL_56_26]OGH05286.1 MAG: isoleucine--tRNA ligase [Candidatus Lambdaproteobacteria bacterium RIFOXYC1_FULL_56_13]OGH09995.1 MAG: isoleucine--tRNA ligase [Candidatus Lambdaproteobacteria bacterium RIFOXYD1_FULL_56_27]